MKLSRTRGINKMIGRRMYDIDPNCWRVGDYGQWNGTWYGLPAEDLLANIQGHEINEHGDGTITVKPSILVSSGDKSWHGFLEKGVWRIA
jgi:hypothetical protein